MTVADAPSLFQALQRVHPRARQVLLARFVAATPEGSGRDPAAFAAFYGVTDEAARVLLWRAVRELEAAAARAEAPAPLPFPEEQARAAALADALDSPAPPAELAPAVALTRALAAHAPALREQLERAEREELASPEYARETWLRRLAIAAVLALSVWYSWDDYGGPLWRRLLVLLEAIWPR